MWSGYSSFVSTIARPTACPSTFASSGLPLFARNRHGAEPTDFGYLFLQQAAAVSAQVADLEREVALAKGLHKGELAIGFGPYAAELLLPHALPRFVSAHPALRVRIQVDSLEVRSTQPCKAEGAAPPPHSHAEISPPRPASGPPTTALHSPTAAQ